MLTEVTNARARCESWLVGLWTMNEREMNSALANGRSLKDWIDMEYMVSWGK